MKVQVRYHLSIRLNLKKTSETLDLEDGASISNLVEILFTRYGEALGNTDQYIFSVGGQPVETAHSLREGDVVSIYPPMAGGYTRPLHAIGIPKQIHG